MAKKLKIIIFDGSYNTTAFINRLTKGLAVHHKVFVLGFNVELSHKLDRVRYVPLGSNQNKLRFVATSLGYAFQSISLPTIFQTFGYLIDGKRQELQEQNLKFALNKIQPDIIHLQWPSVIPWFEDVLEKQRIPVVLSQRGSQNNVRPFVDNENLEYLKQWYPKINGFHSVSKAIAINGDKIWNSPDKLDKVVYTGIPFQSLRFSEKYTRSTPLEILSVGRAHWVKGYDYALQMCRILMEKNFEFHYTIIGGADDEELQFLIADLNLEENVSLLERVPLKEVYKKMKEASLLLMPSVEEGIPNVAVEAMALGLPVLSTECGGILELIENDVEGWIVPRRDPQALAEGVLAFSKLPLKRIEEVRTAARKKVELQHHEQKLIHGMEKLYYQVLNRA